METAEGRAERGEGELRQEEEAVDQEEHPAHVVVASTEAYEEEQRASRSWAPYYRRIAEWCNLLLLGMVVSLAIIFAYAWAQAFRKVRKSARVPPSIR